MAAPKRTRRIRKDITGQRFGRWTVLGPAAPNARGLRRKWHCRCDCGTEKDVLRYSLMRGESKSCGCYMLEWAETAARTHGHTSKDKPQRRTPTYTVWRNVIARCYSPTSTHWDRYGGRGIYVCDRWRHDFQAFLDDMGERPPGMSIERINNDGHYEPNNCRWATNYEQARNRSNNRPITWRGQTMLAYEWETVMGLRPHSIAWRRNRGWDTERMFTQPYRKSRKG